MIGWILAQATPLDPDRSALVRQFIQGGLWTPHGPTPNLVGLWLVSLFLLAVVTALLQQDRAKWLRGVMDIRRNFEQLGAGLDILRRNKRPLGVLFGAAVLSWTGWSLGLWYERSQIAELEGMLLVRENSPLAFAAVHALTSALVPLRDLLSLGDLLPLVLGLCIWLLARATDMSHHLRWETGVAESNRLKRLLGTIWVGLIIMLAYRMVVFLVDRSAAPMSGCLYVDSLLLPVVLLAADGMLLSWVMAEFGRTLRGHLQWHSADTAAFVRGVPAMMLACGLSNPARYVILSATMLEQQLTEVTNRPASRWDFILSSSAIAQLAGLAWFAFPAVVAVCRRGGLANQLRSYLTLLRRAGGQVVGLAALGIVLNLLVTMPFYWLFGSMQPETWSLVGAASYGHYATLFSGLVVLAGVTQLACQELGLEDEPEAVAVLLQPAVATAMETTQAGIP